MKKHNRKPRLCLVSSSGGHWEQLQKLQPLIDKYDGFYVTEKTQFEAKAKYFMKQTDLKDKLMPFKLLWNGLYAVWIWIKERPDFAIDIETIGDLANYDENKLISTLKSHGKMLHDYANGIDDSPVLDEREDAKGYSAETTVEEDLVDLDSILQVILAQADIVAARMRADGGKCRCIGVTFRNLDFVNKSHQIKLKESTDVTDVIFRTAKELIKESWHGEALRLVGLSLSDIDRDGFEQISLFEDPDKEKRKALDASLDSIRGRFGNSAVQRASTLNTSDRINKRFKAEQENDRIKK